MRLRVNMDGSGLPVAGIILLAAMAAAPAWAEEAPGNWFNDPFVQVRQAFPACPTPLGPLISKSEMGVQEHSRAERGTRCYLEGKCSKANSYLYDREIADTLARRFAQSKEFATSTLWFTVQRRFVFIEGCVRVKGEARVLASFARAVRDVEYVVVNVTRTPQAGVPYPTLKN